MTRQSKSQYRRGDIVTGAPCEFGIASGDPHFVEPYPFFTRERTFCAEHTSLQRQVRKNPETGELELVTEEYLFGAYKETRTKAGRLLHKWGEWWLYQNRLAALVRRHREDLPPEAVLAGVPNDGTDPFEWEPDPAPWYQGEGVMRIATTETGLRKFRKQWWDHFMGRMTVKKGVQVTGGAAIDHTGASAEEELLVEEHGPDSTVGLLQDALSANVHEHSTRPSAALVAPSVPQVRNFDNRVFSRAPRGDGKYREPEQWGGDVHVPDWLEPDRRPKHLRLRDAIMRDLGGHATREDEVLMLEAQLREPALYEQARTLMTANVAALEAGAETRANDLIVRNKG